ncbi:MAG: succinate dehydrogenase, cytochrome b556 subunit [Arhodomonas sp.]|nr:succinate dehydrogenase, cytochrome b556 subunit [Arhodomonas sp.]
MTDQRPLSPHIQVYAPQLTSVLSISHRLTGVLLTVGAVVLVVWLAELAWAAEPRLQGWLATALGRVLQVLWSLCLFFHLGNGIRHLCWDSVRGFELRQIYASGWAVIGLTVLATLAYWAVALAVTGAGGAMKRRPRQGALRRAQHLGSAHAGVAHWWWQRVSAVALVPLSLWFVLAILESAGDGAAAAREWLAQPEVATPMLLFLVVLLWHIGLGLRVIVEDYVHDRRWRVPLLAALPLACTALAAVGILAILTLAVGG